MTRRHIQSAVKRTLCRNRPPVGGPIRRSAQINKTPNCRKRQPEVDPESVPISRSCVYYNNKRGLENLNIIKFKYG